MNCQISLLTNDNENLVHNSPEIVPRKPMKGGKTVKIMIMKAIIIQFIAAVLI